MSGHTKGPWALDCGFCLPEVLNDRYHAIIAGCGYHVTDDDDGFEIAACMNTANARLIAVAPELLEACIKALHEMRHTSAPRNSFTDVVDILDAVIDKAKGEA